MFHSSPPVGALRARASKPAYLPQGFRQAFLATGRACSLALAAPLPLFSGARSSPTTFLSLAAPLPLFSLPLAALKPSRFSLPLAALKPYRFSLALAALKPSRRGAASESEQARLSAPGVPPGVFGNRAGLLAGARSAPTTFLWRSQLPYHFSLPRSSPTAFLSPPRSAQALPLFSPPRSAQALPLFSLPRSAQALP